MAEKRDLSLYTRARPDGLSEIELAIDGVSCGACIRRIEGAVRLLPGISDARMNFTNRRLTAVWNAAQVAPADIIDAIEKAGYGAHPYAVRRADDEDAQASKELLKALAVSGFAAMNVMLLSVSVWSGNASDITSETRDFFHWLSALIALPACAYAGRPFFRSAWSALRVRTTNMDVPISLGVLLALGLSLYETIRHAEHAYFDSPVMLLFFLLWGRYLDRAMRARTRAAAGSLAALRADTARKLDGAGQIVEVPAAALATGDRIIVRPGDRVPADGMVVSGASQIDESLVTGETAWREVAAGDTVYAGSRNFTGAMTLRVTAASEETLLDEIERLLGKAQQAKSRHVQLADRAAQLYAPVVHSAAALTLVGWLVAGASVHKALVVAISVLIITCPCALALAAPVVQVIAAGRLFRSGVLLNSGDAIERFAEIDTVVFDKTGTLTLPDARVVDAAAVPSHLMRMAARLALSSRHPLAAAVAREGQGREPFDGVIEEPGSGMRATIDGVEVRLGSPVFCRVTQKSGRHEGNSVIAFSRGNEHVLFEVRQTLRPDAAATVRRLAALGLQLRILSGDRAAAVEPVAAALGIADWQAGIGPAGKVAVLDSLKQEGRRVLMVGDGINDAPSLASAHVSLSPITAADLSQAHADAVFLGAALAPVFEVVTVSRRAHRLMLQNLWLAAGYNAVAVPVAVAGLVTPLIAALAMSASSLLVTLNALRLRARSGNPPVASVPPVMLTRARWSAS